MQMTRVKAAAMEATLIGIRTNMHNLLGAGFEIEIQPVDDTTTLLRVKDNPNGPAEYVQVKISTKL